MPFLAFQQTGKIVLEGGLLKLKDFISIFLFCTVVISIFAMFFLYNIWGIIIFSAFILAVFITILVKLMIEIEDLNKKIEMLLGNKQESKE